MQPRLSNSKKWTALPAEFVEKVSAVFGDNFQSESDAGEFIVDGRLYASEILLRVGYLEKGRLKQMNFEASMDYDPDKKNAVERLYACIDVVASMMEEYFVALESGGAEEEIEEALDFPVSWRPYEFEGETVYLQTSTVNTRLEDEADRLLGLNKSALVRDDEEAEGEIEDALGNAVIDNHLASQVQQQIRRGFGGH